jgi:uncharacterized protein
MSKIIQLNLPYDSDLEKELLKLHPKMEDFRVLNKSLDARKSNRGRIPKFNYSVELIFPGESFEKLEEDFKNLGEISPRPIIIGAGPAGLFCALRLSEYGIPSIVLERGSRAHERMKKISKYWKNGELDPENNVCFGEGGAGLFSDGKLITRVKSPYIHYVMEKLVEFGAPEDILYLSNPHLGSNKIRPLINKITEQLKKRGCEVYYEEKVTTFLTEDQKIIGVKTSEGKTLLSSNIVLASGHSAKDLYYGLKDIGVAMVPKDFAIGVRIEHPRAVIDEIQHGKFATEPLLGSAKYSLKYYDEKNGRGTYSFCMCPGGYVLSSGTDPNGLVANGMSNFARNSHWSNSALVVTVKAGVDFPAKEDVLSGLKFIEKVERSAYELSKSNATGKELPAVTVEEFIQGKLNEKPLPISSSPSHIFKADLTKILPPFVISELKLALLEFDKKMPGFISPNALLIAPETRTSAPVTILRDDESYMSTSHKNLYPCGEGAGYAGGITSSAVDGIKIAMSIIKREKATLRL